MPRWIWCVALLACGKTGPAAGYVAVSGSSPFSSSCADSGGAIYRNSEVEPWLAIDPTNAKHFVAAWQQDRFTNGGAAGVVSSYSFDGGNTWSQSSPPFTRCTGGTYDRGTDPWLSFGPDGVVHQIAFAFNVRDDAKAMLASRSLDGGKSWSAPLTLQLDTDPDFAMDKESITADPNDARYVYAVWDRLTGQTTPTSPDDRGPAWFTRSSDEGVTWDPPKVIYDPGADAQTIANQIAVLPNGTLVNLLTVITANSTNNPQSSIAVLLSSDKGATWSQPITVAQALFVGTVDPKNGEPVRTGDVVASIGVDSQSGAIYVAWEDARFSGEVRDGIALSKSLDSGQTWSAPVQVNGDLAAQAFTPVVAVEQGTVGVTYYDLRDDTGQTGQLLAAHWLATSKDGGQTFADARQSEPFDLQTAPLAEGYFLGDYEGLAHAGGAFFPLFTIANSGDTDNRTNIVFRPAGLAPLANSTSLRSRANQLFSGSRERWRFGTTRRREMD